MGIILYRMGTRSKTATTTMKFYITLFLLSFGALAFSVSAQVSTVKRVVNGKEYVVHTIQKGQTVYSISKLYGVTDKEIFAANPVRKPRSRPGPNCWFPPKIPR